MDYVKNNGKMAYMYNIKEILNHKINNANSDDDRVRLRKVLGHVESELSKLTTKLSSGPKIMTRPKSEAEHNHDFVMEDRTTVQCGKCSSVFKPQWVGISDARAVEFCPWCEEDFFYDDAEQIKESKLKIKKFWKERIDCLTLYRQKNREDDHAIMEDIRRGKIKRGDYKVDTVIPVMGELDADPMYRPEEPREAEEVIDFYEEYGIAPIKDRIRE